MRHAFGGTLADWVIADTGGTPTLVPGSVITAWNLQAGGSQYTDLAIDAAGSSTMDHVTSDTNGRIDQFFGPDDVWALWISADNGDRLLMISSDVANAIAGQATSIVDLTSDLSEHIEAVNPHGTKFEDLSNAAPAEPLDGQVWSYHAATRQWQPANGTSATSALVIPFSVFGDLEITDGLQRIYNDSGSVLTIDCVRASVGVPSVGSGITFDVLRNGTSIFDDPQSLDAGETTTGKLTTFSGSNTHVLADGDYLTIAITEVGSTTPGTDLMIQLHASY